MILQVELDKVAGLCLGDERPSFIGWHGPLFTIFEMLDFYASHFANVVSLLGAIGELMRSINSNGSPLSRENKAFIKKQLIALGGHCAKIGLDHSCRQIQRTIEMLKVNNVSSLSYAFRDIRLRIIDELESMFVLYVPHEKVAYYSNPIGAFGDSIIKKFPSLVTDIEEASKCYAMSRNTACIFHLSRIAEAGLRAIGKTLNIAIHNPSWDAILKKCDAELTKPIAERATAWRVSGHFFSEATAQLRAVKNAWRNPVMHVGTKYTEEETLDIFYAVRGLMRHLATKLEE